MGAVGAHSTLVVAVAAAALAGCDSSGGAGNAAKCTDRFVQASVKRGESHVARGQLRRYVAMTYCEPFARKGWVYDDGALSIEAQRWLAAGTREGGSEVCATATPGGSGRTVPCTELERRDEPRVIDCALLHFVRRSEVRRFVAQLQRQGGINCDDGTRMAVLGVP